MKISWGKILGYGLLILIVASLLWSVVGYRSSEVREVPLTELISILEQEKISRLVVENDSLHAFSRDGVEYLSHKESGVSVFEIEAVKNQVAEGALELEIKNKETAGIWINVLASLLPFLLIFGFLWFILRQAQGASNQALSFGRSRARMLLGGEKTKVTFKDVAGSVEAKQELWEVVEFLKYPSKFRSLGARIPKGVLLLGPPGTGKTLLAKAVAGEAGVPFFNISGSEFVEMFVGVGAARVRDLFTRAKRNAPSIVFIDEIDAVGRQRGAGLGGSHDEREQTLNQILVEMDGFETDTNVIIMAATNRPDILDPALLRPGRFDRRVVLDWPDINEREEILQIHAKGKPLAGGVDLRRIASQTSGFSGADLSNLVNEAAILAARANKKKIEHSDLSQAVEKVLLGPERRSSILSEEEKKIVAYHEAGHGIVSHILPHGDPVQKISVVSRGMALGYHWSLPLEERKLHSRAKFLDEVSILLGGYVAEEMIFGDITTGAANDLRRATQLARKMVTEYGMSKRLGPMTFGEKDELVFLGREIHEQKNYSEKVASMIDEEVADIITESKRKAEEVLRKCKKELKAIAARLTQVETLEGEEFESFFEKETK